MVRKHSYGSQQGAGVIDDRVRRAGYPDMRAMHSADEWEHVLAESQRLGQSRSGRPVASLRGAAAAAEDDGSEPQCMTCGGTGRLKHPVTGKPGKVCPACGGTGTAPDEDAEDGQAPGAALDQFPWARSWGSFFGAIRDEDDRTGARQVIRNVMESTRPRASGGLGERIPAEGGFLVPERLRAQVLSYMTTAAVRPRATVVPMDSLRVPIPVLDNPTQGSSTQALGGLTFSFVQEGAAIPATTPQFGRIALEARKLAAYLASVPNELLTDSPAFTDVFLTRVIAEGYSWVEDDYFIGTNGTGVGCPQSLINAPCAVGIDRGTASEILFADIISMYKSLHPASKTTATWLVGNDTMAYLLELYLAVGSVTTQGIAPPDWLTYSDTRGCWTMLGLELIATDHQPALGTTGDVVLADLDRYLIGDLQQLTVEISGMGSGFISDTSNIRIRSRVDGRYWIQSSTTTESGQTTAPIVVLDTHT